MAGNSPPVTVAEPIQSRPARSKFEVDIDQILAARDTFEGQSLGLLGQADCPQPDSASPGLGNCSLADTTSPCEAEEIGMQGKPYGVTDTLGYCDIEPRQSHSQEYMEVKSPLFATPTHVVPPNKPAVPAMPPSPSGGVSSHSHHGTNGGPSDRTGGGAGHKALHGRRRPPPPPPPAAVAPSTLAGEAMESARQPPSPGQPPVAVSPAHRVKERTLFARARHSSLKRSRKKADREVSPTPPPSQSPGLRRKLRSLFRSGGGGAEEEAARAKKSAKPPVLDPAHLKSQTLPNRGRGRKHFDSRPVAQDDLYSTIPDFEVSIISPVPLFHWSSSPDTRSVWPSLVCR